MFLLVCREGTFQALNAMPALISIILLPLSNEKAKKNYSLLLKILQTLCPSSSVYKGNNTDIFYTLNI